MLRQVRKFSNDANNRITNTSINFRKFARRFLFSSALGAYGYYQYAHYERNLELSKKLDIPFYEVLLYKLIPFSALSSIAGWIGEKQIQSEAVRVSLFKIYSKLFGCNLDEASKSLTEYKSFNDFFSRSLKDQSRTISKVDGIVSACDGKILHFGEIDGPITRDSIYPEQVKGSLYALKDLVGEDNCKAVSGKKGKSLYFCTVYLAPGDYHRFHSPANIKVRNIETFSGELLSVAPFMMKYVPKLLCMNERVAITGSWKHGFFSYVPVGAANVGSISINDSIRKDKWIKTGEEIGCFRLGSTIVLIFEAPSGADWKVLPGDKVKLGQVLLTMPKKCWF